MFILGEKTASMPPGYPGEENLWAAGFRLVVEEETWDFRLISRQHGANSVLIMALVVMGDKNV